MLIFGKKIDKPKEKIIILVTLISFYILIKLSILFFAFDKISGYGFRELQFGACARELIRSFGLPFSCYDYIGSGLCKLTNSCAAALLNDILAIPLFMLFGDSYLVLKLIPLLFNLAILIFLYLFLYKFFSKRIAVISSVLLIIPPSIFTKLSFGCNTNKCEFILFTIFTMYIFYEIFFTKKRNSINFILLGLITALGLCLNYIFLITLVTCFLMWFIFDKLFFLRKEFFIFIVAFIVCLAPWAYYVNHNIGGIYIYSKPIFKHFMGNGIIDSLIRFKDIISINLFNLFLLEDIGFVKGYFLGSIYYLIFILSFFVFFYLNVKYLFKLLFKIPYRKQLQIFPEDVSRELFIFIYLIVFFIAYSFSDFSIGERYSKFNIINYRFLSSIYPFLCVIIALSLNRLTFKKYLHIISNSIIIILIFVSLLSNLSFISFHKFGEGLAYEGFWYIELGNRFALRFGEKINKAVYLINQVDNDNRELMYQGFASGLITGIIIDKLDYNSIIQSIKMVNQQIEKKHRIACYEGLGLGFGQVVWEDRAMDGINFIKEIDREYQGYFYCGICEEMGSRFVFGLDSAESLEKMINNIDQSNRHFCYQGIGLNLGWNHEYNISDCINNIKQFNRNYRGYCYYGVGKAFGIKVNYNNIVNYIDKINQVDKDYRAYSYQGLGQGVTFRYGHDIKRCVEMMDKVDEAYRLYCYYGSGLAIGAKYGYDINKCKEILGQIAKKYSGNFSRGLEDGIRQFWGNEVFL